MLPLTRPLVCLDLEAPAPARQLALPMVAAAPAEALALVEFIAPEDWEPGPADERVDAATVLTWTTDAEDRWRTVVPGWFAPWVRARLALGGVVERPSNGPLHVVRVGDAVATTLGPCPVVGFVRDPSEASTGLVLAPNRCDRVVAWLDSATMQPSGAGLTFGVSVATCVELVDDEWRVERSAPAPKAAPVAPPALAKKTASKKPAKTPEPQVSRWVLDADWQAMPEAERAHLFAGANHRTAGSAYRELGPMPLPVAIDLDADAAGVVPLFTERPVEQAPLKPAPKKSAPGSKGHPHRGTPVPEADALAQFGVTVAAALQPDGHWKLWASNPEQAGGALVASPEWKKRWHRARQSDLRVRLYNRAGRCTHDSLDGDAGGDA